MPRKLLLVSVIGLLVLSVCVILTLGMSPAGSLLTNSLQIVCCGLAAATCFAASKRGRGLSRPFWILVACSIATWAVANLGWMYYENWLHVPVPRFSLVRILFDVQGVFYAIALFLDKEKDSQEFTAEMVLDSVQIAIVFLSLFFGLFYAQVLQGAQGQFNELVVTEIFVGISLTLTLIALVQAFGAKTKRIRSLYGGLALFLFVYTLGSGLAESPWANKLASTGSWYDLGWTIPFLFAVMWAGRWQEDAEAAAPAKFAAKTLKELALKNVMLALAPLIVLILVARLGAQWRMIGLSLLAVSIISYVVRLGITEFRQSQTSAAVMRHRAAMESTEDGMAILDASGVHVYANSAFARMVGFPNAQAVLGKTWQQVYDPRDVTQLVAEVRASVQKTGKWSGQVALHRPDDTILPVEMAITLMAPDGTVCVARDITDRLNTEHARAEAEIKYRTLVEQVAAISYIAEIGATGQWLFVSPQVETILGYPQDEWLAGSCDWMRYVVPEDHPIVLAAEERSLRGEPFQAEYRITRKDGEIIWVSDNAVVVRGSDSHPVMEGLIVDITDRKLLENQLQQARKMEAVGRLAGGVAHDFNNLLTIIKGYIEMALQRCLDRPELHSDIRRIEEAADRAVTLVRQLLAFSRKQVLRPKVLDLNAIVMNLDQLLRRLMPQNIEMKTFVSKDVAAVKADPGQIEQVIMNLVVNARDAMPDGGRILVETSNIDLDSTYSRDHAVVVPGPYVLLAVSDTGIGMTADTVAHIFEPFYTTKESGRGTGLGLSTVYGIVKQSGGYIWVYSEPRKGATFKVYLPRVKDAVSDLPAHVPSASTTRKGHETILLVEDEPDVRELTQMVLSERGYTVIEAPTPADAERLAVNNGAEIHLLLTDVVMPGISGSELAKRLTGQFPNLRVLFMSGYTHNLFAQDGTLEEGISFLQKPFTPQVLMEKVREALDRPVSAK
jgi:two-component system cell cycle sensor histidine kinase/response regulator CckA